MKRNIPLSYVSLFLFSIFTLLNRSQDIALITTSVALGGMLETKGLISKTANYDKQNIYFWVDQIIHIVPCMITWLIVQSYNKTISYNSIWLAVLLPILYYLFKFRLNDKNNFYDVKISNIFKHFSESYDNPMYIYFGYYLPIILYVILNKQ